MAARENILGRLRSASGRRSASADFSTPDVSAYYARHRAEEPAGQRLARFRAAIEAAHAEVHETSSAGWPQKLAEILAAKKLRHLLVGRSLDAAPLSAITQGSPEIVAYDRSIDSWKSGLFEEIDCGLSRARSAIAATGSLILWTGPDEPRLLSLVPPVNFVLLDAEAIHADLHAAMTAEGWAGSLPTNALLVSGPSKTADIQQTLAYGAHGPRELIVLVILPQGAAS